MSTIEENIRVLSDRVKTQSNSLLTEEAAKTAVILPFLRALGYDVFNPEEVIPEFTADAVGKKGEKVDYVIKFDGDIRILIECKPITTKLEKTHLAQLYRYFSVTTAKFAILTNGRFFHFHTDLDEPNKLDAKPFLTFDITDLQSSAISELKKFEKNNFNIENILATAERLKYTSGIKVAINQLLESPSEDFVRIVCAGVYEGRLTATAKEMLTGVTKSAFQEVIKDNVQNRLSTALAATEQSAPTENLIPAVQEDDIVTTDEEVEGYMLIKSIVRDIIRPNRIFIRDAKSYCAILVDDNNRKPLARMHFNRTTKYIGLFNGEAEERIAIDSLDHIFDFSDRLRETAQKYSA
ncbi:type I restriction enzyme HsdR N-terminal domain-containing protein [Pseudochrobactrum sp. sp1633]|uniref:type I restriction endonuclease n=1 Tax=Pseudochrobactrum sp. sp1633 TaxID=3036706 RepID=UPI0025A61C02|nr:type I restriction endonuclease [Pseudochrobactrum sp. sp1633]MDM8346740.1 type I restriction enzyme HsdR N-terminal domain-containing protein [Pseudochrobactrum sp. sp1633]HWD13340.1 type I restriction endonuclease [Pseudochrobactrum sp.]